MEERHPSQREREEKYRTLVENANDGIAMLRHSRHIYVNQKFAEILGYESPEELIGKSLDEIVHPDDIQRVIDRASQMQEAELPGHVIRCCFSREGL